MCCRPPLFFIPLHLFLRIDLSFLCTTITDTHPTPLRIRPRQRLTANYLFIFFLDYAIDRLDIYATGLNFNGPHLSLSLSLSL